MTNDHTEIDPRGISQLFSAVKSASQLEVDRIVEAVIDKLRSRSPIGTFDEIAARHMWDEYCWVLQEGPFDDNISGLGSLSGNWDSTVHNFVSSEIEMLPRHLQMFLTIYASKYGSLADEYELGSIWIEAVESVIMGEIAEKALRRTLDLIGPHRSDVIGYEVSSSGLVCSTLSNADLLSDILASHVDTMIDAEADLSVVTHEVIDVYMGLVYDEADSSTELSELLAHFDSDIRALLKDKDVLPALEHMQGEILDVLDA
ncbi:hypothetical protein ABC383_17695 [Noviherbaspirillum sp. 1P10PC]|uniref:hypothetical protein n=1 Tax=Noviherbaspirillum sp. 1P10PC TaxID=3132292 RepID=UPI0039A207AB